ncbi:Ubiquinone biosynthesis protein [Rhodosporidiobolus nylandii]
MVATLSETAFPTGALTRLHSHLRSTPSGRAILRERPRITEASIDLERLGKLEEGTFGRAYFEWLRRNRVTPDTRDPVRYIDNPTHAYIMQRYRESHDFYHVLLSFGVSLPAELVVKWFELSNFGLPVALLSGLFGPLRMEPAERRRLWDTYGAWALRAGARAECLIGVYWEREWETPISELRERLGVERPPVGFAKWREEQRRIRREEGERRAREGV